MRQTKPGFNVSDSLAMIGGRKPSWAPPAQNIQSKSRKKHGTSSLNKGKMKQDTNNPSSQPFQRSKHKNQPTFSYDSGRQQSQESFIPTNTCKVKVETVSDTNTEERVDEQHTEFFSPIIRTGLTTVAQKKKLQDNEQQQTQDHATMKEHQDNEQQQAQYHTTKTTLKSQQQQHNKASSLKQLQPKAAHKQTKRYDEQHEQYRNSLKNGPKKIHLRRSELKSVATTLDKTAPTATASRHSSSTTKGCRKGTVTAEEQASKQYGTPVGSEKPCQFLELKQALKPPRISYQFGSGNGEANSNSATSVLSFPTLHEGNKGNETINFNVRHTPVVSQKFGGNEDKNSNLNILFPDAATAESRLQDELPPAYICQNQDRRIVRAKVPQSQNSSKDSSLSQPETLVVKMNGLSLQETQLLLLSKDLDTELAAVHREKQQLVDEVKEAGSNVANMRNELETMVNTQKEETQKRITRSSQVQLSLLKEKVELKQQTMRDATEQFSSLKEDLKIRHKGYEDEASTLQNKMDTIKKAVATFPPDRPPVGITTIVTTHREENRSLIEDSFAVVPYEAKESEDDEYEYNCDYFNEGWINTEVEVHDKCKADRLLRESAVAILHKVGQSQKKHSTTVLAEGRNSTVDETMTIRDNDIDFDDTSALSFPDDISDADEDMSEAFSGMSVSSNFTKKEQKTLMDGSASSNQYQSQQLLTTTPHLLQEGTDKKECTLVNSIHKSTLQLATLPDNSASRNLHTGVMVNYTKTNVIIPKFDGHLANLGLQSGEYTWKEVKKAYHKCIRLYHPDKNMHKNDEAKAIALKIFDRVDASYDILKQSLSHKEQLSWLKSLNVLQKAPFAVNFGETYMVRDRKAQNSWEPIPYLQTFQITQEQATQKHMSEMAEAVKSGQLNCPCPQTSCIITSLAYIAINSPKTLAAQCSPQEIAAIVLSSRNVCLLDAPVNDKKHERGKEQSDSLALQDDADRLAPTAAVNTSINQEDTCQPTSKRQRKLERLQNQLKTNGTSLLGVNDILKTRRRGRKTTMRTALPIEPSKQLKIVNSKLI